jgi:hypothetical protein
VYIFRDNAFLKFELNVDSRGKIFKTIIFKKLSLLSKFRHKNLNLSRKRNLSDNKNLENFFSKKIPICGVLGGGYNKDFKKLIELHSFLHQSCAKLI